MMLQPYARRLVVLHNFPRLDLFPDGLTPPSEKPYDIVYHGTIPKYHLEVCLAVDAALSARGYSARWRFIGTMAERNWFNKELAQRGAAGRFSITGLMPHDQISREVSKAKIGIIPLPDLPKFHNNIPQKLFEFMALRMPVVLSDLPPTRPFVGDGSCAFRVPPRDYGGYADSIIKLLDNPALRQKMGNEGRRRVEQEYNWEKESQKLLALYDELLVACTAI
jgi:glycosyltransferase involved in cell wall biosynthesis